MLQETHSNKIQLKPAGIFFIVAAVSSILGLKLYDPILNDPDFIQNAVQNQVQIIFGAVNEIILMATATGTGIVLYPYLKRYSETLALGYLSFRILEVFFIMLGMVSVLTVLSISEYYTNEVITSLSEAKSMGLTFVAIHKWTFMLGPNFMLAINTFIYSFVFFKTGGLPSPISIWGIVSSCLILLAAILEIFGFIEQISFWGITLAVPIALYEMTIAVLMIRKPISYTSAGISTRES